MSAADGSGGSTAAHATGLDPGWIGSYVDLPASAFGAAITTADGFGRKAAAETWCKGTISGARDDLTEVYVYFDDPRLGKVALSPADALTGSRQRLVHVAEGLVWEAAARFGRPLPLMTATEVRDIARLVGASPTSDIVSTAIYDCRASQNESLALLRVSKVEREKHRAAAREEICLQAASAHTLERRTASRRARKAAAAAAAASGAGADDDVGYHEAHGDGNGDGDGHGDGDGEAAVPDCGHAD